MNRYPGDPVCHPNTLPFAQVSAHVETVQHGVNRVHKRHGEYKVKPAWLVSAPHQFVTLQSLDVAKRVKLGIKVRRAVVPRGIQFNLTFQYQF